MENLKKARKNKNYTQDKLAKLLGVSRSTVAMWESGSSQPDNRLLSVLADILDVSVDYLLGREDRQPTLDEQLEGINFALSGEIRDLNDAEKQDILDYIRFKKQQKKGE